jgi:hypothetical protein
MSNEQKTPLARTLPLFVGQTALGEILKAGLALPGHVLSVTGQIVTVAFDVTGLSLPQVTMPVAGSVYVQLPIQAGDKGVALPASVFLGGVSGLGTGTADIAVQEGNLSSLIWVPVSNTAWDSGAPTSVVIAGPGGVILKNTAGTTIATLTGTTITLSGQDTVTVEVGGVSVVITSSGVTIAGYDFASHTHGPGTFEADSQAVVGISGPVLT